jgi:hypothetical protein
MTVLIEGHVPDVMGSVFNTPVSSVKFQETFCICLLWSERSNPVDGFRLHFAGFETGYFPFDFDNLPTVRKSQVVVEEGGSP